jgi:NAD(P)-dependent dehydrogenase (short-subunit alcohol dehydrogenase family)
VPGAELPDNGQQRPPVGGERVLDAGRHFSKRFALHNTTFFQLAQLLGEHLARDERHLDVLFANAGIAEFAPIEVVTEAQYDRQFDINVKGTFFTVQKALPLLADGAAIVLMASIVGSKDFEANSVYSATKAAVRSLARTLTSDLKTRKIRVNTVSPGPIETPGLNNIIDSPEQLAQFKAQMTSGVPMGRIGEADEIAKAVVFLASDDSSYVTGIELFVDGGMAQV